MSDDAIWTAADDAAALAEGWNVFQTSGGGLRIEADARSRMFDFDRHGFIKADGMARDFVRKQAEGGSALHIKAMNLSREPRT